jgi:hypothetical protein
MRQIDASLDLSAIERHVSTQLVRLASEEIITFDIPFLVIHGINDELTLPCGSEYLYMSSKTK